MFELHHLSAQDQWDWLQRGEVSPVELAEHYLRRIDQLNGELGAFARVDGDAALARAGALTKTARSAELWGLPLADKELSQRAGSPATSGSRALSGRIADSSDAIVTVLDAAGAISLGATTAPEFGFPSYTEPLGRPPARNPWNLDLGSGGSSGGAAVAVAAGLLPFAPGTDGGGSVRIPAAATGLVGIKPSRFLIGADRWSLGDLVVNGPLARSVGDAAMLLDAMIARRGAGAGGGPVPDRLLGYAVRGEGRFQLGITTQSQWDTGYDIVLDPAARTALESTAEILSELGHGLDDVALPDASAYPAAFRALWQGGASALPLDDSQLELVEPLTAWLVRRGRALPVRELVEGLGALAAFSRTLIDQWFGAHSARVDAVLTPALAMTPRPIGWWDADDAERNFAQQVQYTPFTSFVNVAGLPAITLPVSQTDEGLPMGVQLVGPPGGEATLLSIGRQLERRLSWQTRHPAMW